MVLDIGGCWNQLARVRRNLFFFIASQSLNASLLDLTQYCSDSLKITARSEVSKGFTWSNPSIPQGERRLNEQYCDLAPALQI
jgi:hypothetical protein